MTYMYLGPDIKAVVRHNQIFMYKPEGIIKKACEVSELARCLFVKAEDIVESKKALAKKDSFLAIVYKDIEKKTKNNI